MVPAANGEELPSLSQSELPQKGPSAPGSEEKSGAVKALSPPRSAEERMDKVPARQTGAAQAAEGSTVVANVPPQPLKQLLPKLKRSEFSDDQKTVDIDIQVTVDADGNVTQAHPMGNSAGRNPQLSESAVATAKRWKFKPAEHLGKNVSGTYVINFQFQRPN
jgi:TonB family protein